MTTGGEGGMVTTNDDALWLAMWSYKDHGKSYEAVYQRNHPPGFRWVHESFGTNWRMMEMQAAIGRIQLRRMADWTAQRQAHAIALTSALSLYADLEGPVRLPGMKCTLCVDDLRSSSATRPCASGCAHAYYKYYAYVRPQNLAPNWTRNRIVEAISNEGVPCYQGSCSEVYLEKAFDRTGWRPNSPLPAARELGETSLMFLVHPTLTADEIKKTCEVVARVLRIATDVTQIAAPQPGNARGTI